LLAVYAVKNGEQFPTYTEPRHGRCNTSCMAIPLHHDDGGPLDDRRVIPTQMAPQIRSTASLIAIVCAIGSFVLSAKGREMLALLCAVLAIGGGLLGGLRALSPRVSGGLISIFAILLGVIGIVVALIALVV
jgi:hypothetical protein